MTTPQRIVLIIYCLLIARARDIRQTYWQESLTIFKLVT